MKAFALIALLLFFACSNEDKVTIDDVPLETRPLLGDWQLTGSKISIGGPLPDDFREENKGHIFTFELNATYRLVANDNTLISEGTFTYTEDSLVLNPKRGELKEVTSYQATIEKNEMVLSPSGPVICIEGCLYRYVKLN